MKPMIPMTYKDMLSAINRDLWRTGDDARLDLPVVLAVMDERGQIHCGRVVACSLGEIPPGRAHVDESRSVDLRPAIAVCARRARLVAPDDAVVTSAARVPPRARVPPPALEFPAQDDDEETRVFDPIDPRDVHDLEEREVQGEMLPRTRVTGFRSRSPSSLPPPLPPPPPFPSSRRSEEDDTRRMRPARPSGPPTLASTRMPVDDASPPAPMPGPASSERPRRVTLVRVSPAYTRPPCLVTPATPVPLALTDSLESSESSVEDASMIRTRRSS